MAREHKYNMMARYGPFLMAILLAITLSGCSSPYTVPFKLVRFNEMTEAIESKPVGPPSLRITTHSDGLGWTVQPEQHVERRVRVTQEETWEGKRYTKKEQRWYYYPFIAAFDTAFLCPAGLLVQLYEGLHVTKPTYESPWEACLLMPAGFNILKPEPGTITKPMPSSEIRTTLDHEAMTSGRVSLLWVRKGQDPIGIEETIPATTTPIVFRLHWLAEVLQRHGWTPASEHQGHLIFRVAHNAGTSADIPLSVTVEGIQTALSNHVTRVPSSHWPGPIRVRVVSQDHGAESKRSRALEDQLIHYLTQQNIPVVLRGTQHQQTERLQIRQMQPAYQDSQQIGQWTGATLLLAATHDTPGTDSSLITVTAANIETGEIVGSFRLEGRTAEWTRLLDTVGAKLQELLPNGRNENRLQRKEGVLISE